MMMFGEFSIEREVRVTVEVCDGFDLEGNENVCFKKEFLLGTLDDGLASLADVELVLKSLEETHSADKEKHGCPSLTRDARWVESHTWRGGRIFGPAKDVVLIGTFGDLDMGGWTDSDEGAFRAALIAQLTDDLMPDGSATIEEIVAGVGITQVEERAP